MKHSKATKILLGLMMAVLVSLFLLPLVGRTSYSPSVLLCSPLFSPIKEGTDISVLIFWGERFPKTMLAMVAGSGLALAGMTLQSLFRNPLATPYTLGIASGASFGATLYLYIAAALTAIGLPICLMGISLITWSAFAGAILATWIVFQLSGGRNAGGNQMLLAGVAVSYFFSSLILCFQYIADPSRTFQMLRWTMGGIDRCDLHNLTVVTICVLTGGIALFLFSRELNLLLAGEERATAFGLQVERFRLVLFFLSSLMVGAVVSLCGPIGFVGLMVPHLCRLLVGNDHRILTPTVFLFGAVFMALCYTFSRIVLYPTLLPVGMITSLLGGPFFLCLLLKR